MSLGITSELTFIIWNRLSRSACVILSSVIAIFVPLIARSLDIVILQWIQDFSLSLTGCYFSKNALAHKFFPLDNADAITTSYRRNVDGSPNASYPNTQVLRCNGCTDQKNCEVNTVL